MNGPMAMTGQELIILRKNLGLSQTGLAARLDLSRSSIWRYEVENQKIPEVVSLAMMALSIISKAPMPRPIAKPAGVSP
jgi:transcriptional regulator with XRE-family HTH domain